MNYDFVNIFPTTIYVGDIENHSEYKEEFYKIYPKFHYEQIDEKLDYIHTVSENQGNPLIHLEENLDPLFSDVCAHVKNYMLNVLCLKDIFNIVITKTWLSRSQGVDQEIPWHIHSPSQISFVYYLNTPENSHSIQFSNKNRPNHIFPTIFTEDYGNPEVTMVSQYNDVNSEMFYILPQEGKIIIFPSHVPHRTKSVSSDFEGERLAITGDITLVLKDEYLSFSNGYIHEKYWKKYP